MSKALVDRISFLINCVTHNWDLGQSSIMCLNTEDKWIVVIGLLLCIYVYGTFYEIMALVV